MDSAMITASIPTGPRSTGAKRRCNPIWTSTSVQMMMRPSDRDWLFRALSDRTVVTRDADLPTTGLGAELERALSPLFVPLCQIHGQPYGTRTSTVVERTVVERHHPNGAEKILVKKKPSRRRQLLTSANEPFLHRGTPLIQSSTHSQWARTRFFDWSTCSLFKMKSDNCVAAIAFDAF